LIKKHPVAYSPSASLLQFSQKKGSGKLKTCASFGVDFKEEAKGVANLFNTKARNDKHATKDRVCENCIDKDIVHFSCHGHFDNLDSLSSGIELYDGILTAREIFDMRLKTELVTLSACQTGLNERRPGDELIGLTRAFLYAGAPSIIVSLWSVDVGSTQELMLEFYRLLKNGSDKATALQEAQKKIMEQDKYSHPYYWAPFVLIGDWK
jgi:CHAT domain-containing protein